MNDLVKNEETIKIYRLWGLHGLNKAGNTNGTTRKRKSTIQIILSTHTGKLT